MLGGGPPPPPGEPPMPQGVPIAGKVSFSRKAGAPIKRPEAQDPAVFGAFDAMSAPQSMRQKSSRVRLWLLLLLVLSVIGALIWWLVL